MKYLCLVYFEQSIWDTMSESDAAAINKESMAYDEELKNSGYLITAQALQSVQTATTLSVRNGNVSVTDGPFAETKEVLGGFLLIEARDLNDAIRVASRVPLARLGKIEVRPVMEVRPSEVPAK